MNVLKGPDPVARARAIAPAIEQAADDIERTQRIPPALLNALHESRLFRMLLPQSVGGDEIEPWVYLRAVEEISRHDASVGWNVFVANSSALIAPFLPPDTAQTIFADPRTVVAWGPPNGCKAHAVPGGYRLTGEWDFASGCRAANWLGAHCQVVEPDGSLRLNARGKPLIRSLLFPVEQVQLIGRWNVIGLRGTASDAYAVSNLFVPEAFSGTREEPEARQEPGRLYAFTMQGLYAVGVAGVAIGIARAMLDAFIALAQEKTPRGLQRLADSPAAQAEVAECEARLGSAAAWLTEVLAEIWARAGEVPAIGIPDRARVRLACALAIRNGLRVADVVYKAAGVSAIFAGTAFERRFRDIHTLSQQIQSRDAHFQAVGAILLGNTPEVFY
jgi:alkylation response protein AidB-like acyl-CoA dehydrogenase